MCLPRGHQVVTNWWPVGRQVVNVEVKHGWARVLKRINFWKGSKRHLTPTTHPSEWSLSLKIMCMHFILSGPRTSFHIFVHIHYKKSAA